MLANQTAFGRTPEIGAKDRQYYQFVKVKGLEQLCDIVTCELGQMVKIQWSSGRKLVGGMDFKVHCLK